jgi:hypothetical protein
MPAERARVLAFNAESSSPKFERSRCVPYGAVGRRSRLSTSSNAARPDIG